MVLPLVGEIAQPLGLLLLIAGVLLLSGSYFLVRQGLRPDLRPLGGYDALLNQVGQAVESGGRMHVSLGANSIIGEETGVTIAGLAILDIASDASAISDRTPVATTADATTIPVMADTIRRAYRERGTLERYESSAARLVAFDAISLAAGTTSIIVDDDVRANVLAGSFGPESALIVEAGQRKGISQVVASDRAEAQAMGYAMADHILIGEEMFAARAYLEQDHATLASLITQDILRWILIGAIGIGFILQLFATLQ
jgi:hypothetical protein